MRRGFGVPTGLLLITSGLVLAPPPAGSTGPAAPQALVVTVTGEGADSYPAYDPDVRRFGILSSATTDGTVEVTVTTDDPAARVRVNGARAPLGAAHEVTGLRVGDEVNVQVTSAAGDTNQSWIYLPPQFPRLTTSGTQPGPDPDDLVFLGLSSFLADTGYETVVDAHGVPVRVRAADEPNDFKANEHGPDYSIFEPVKASPDDTEYGYRVLEYGPGFRYGGTERLRPVPEIGLTADDTDFHDVQYLADGRMVLLGYHRTFYGPEQTPWLDAVIQVVDRTGTPELTWTSRGEVDPSEAYVLGAKGQDYAHINSVEMQPDGDLVASFRNTGQVLRIATVAHDGFQPGEVVWRLGGERNEFTFVGDPLGGFCAQHDARILPNGHLTLFDNGSRRDTGGPVAPQTADMCPDPANPTGPRVARPQSRIVEYALDTDAMTATLVWEHTPQGRYAAFAGNAQHLDDDSFLASWSRSEGPGPGPEPIATRVDRTGQELWSISSNGWFSYRASAAPVPDRTPPRIRVELPSPHATYPEGTPIRPEFSCLDQGGSNLAGCEVDSITGDSPGSPGRHVITLRTTDSAGNSAFRRFPYHVLPLRQPDLQLRAHDGHWLGDGEWPSARVLHAAPRFTRVGETIRFRARVVNAGLEGEPYRMRARGSGDGWSVRYFDGRQDVTDALVSGRLRTPRLTPGGSWQFRVVIRRTAAVAEDTERLIWVRARSTQKEAQVDRIALEARAR